ncbi:MAG: helix-turn-helix domain-containing protein [Blastocatellia bacterium]|nr:helix-turn-helix domain-containing protein [Blastocatellia bacterium]
MKCEQCNSETSIGRKRYHYTECGLDNVYLQNCEVRICPSCGLESPRIPRIDELHAAIAQAITLQKVPLSGKEARFLRKHLGLKAREWAKYLHIDVTTLSRWENEERSIGPQSDVLMRLTYCYLYFRKQGLPIHHDLVEAIKDIDMSIQAEIPALLVNPRYPSRYSYHPLSDLAA